MKSKPKSKPVDVRFANGKKNVDDMHADQDETNVESTSQALREIRLINALGITDIDDDVENPLDVLSMADILLKDTDDDD